MRLHRLTVSALAAVGLSAVLGQVASGADIPSSAQVTARKPIVSAPATSNWTGFYVGGNIGWAWVRSVNTVVTDVIGAFPPGFQVCCHRDGLIGGLQAGLNWQTGNWVFGIEGDWSWTNSTRTVNTPSPAFPGVVATAIAKDKWYFTGTGRVGYAQDNRLIYVKGGVAVHAHSDTASLAGTPVGTIVFDTHNEKKTGWTLGGGVEWALWSSWSAKLEYNYMNFGKYNDTFTAIAPAAAVGGQTTTQFDTQVHVIKVGVNYRFGGGR